MDILDVRELCLSLPQSEETTPFDETTLVYKVAGKMFLLADMTDGRAVNVKCDPDHAIALRERYAEVTPGWHMNKRHWNTVRIDGDLPEKLIRDFAQKVEKLYIVEELDSCIEDHVRALGVVPDGGKNLTGPLGELSQGKLRRAFGLPAPETAEYGEPLPGRPPVMCPGCPHRGLFTVLKKLKLTVTGDIGCYTLGSMSPLTAMDTSLCMGASIGMAHGFTKVRPEAAGKTVAVIGDSTFMHSGITGLINVVYNLGSGKVIVMDNHITGMTGHQQNPTTGFNLKGDPCTKIDLESLCRSVGIRRVRVVDPYDLAQCDAAVKEELAADEPSVIISRRPCALLKYVKHKKPLVVDADKCRSCKMCMKIGCPAISMTSGKAEIDNTLCTGCGVCEQLCKFDALHAPKED